MAGIKPKKTPAAEKLVPLLDLGPEEVAAELTGRLASWDEKPYRTRQILRQIYQRRNLDFCRMSDLSAGLREKLASTYKLLVLEAQEESFSRDGTKKTLWSLEDSACLESVTIPMKRDRSTLCLSTQTGCALKCTFCATGQLGAGRNLTPGEILCQVLILMGCGNDSGIGQEDRSRAPNIVFMGMGEPFLNYENLKKALSVLNHNDFMQVGARRITVSTVGLPDEIVRFSRDFPQMKLAVSLHAAHEPLRKKLMPVARRFSLASVIEACREANRITGRRITFEYLVIQGVNDLPEDVEALTRLTSNLPCKINLIPFNPVEGVPFKPPSQEELEIFQKRLLVSCKQAVTLRRSHGTDIEGACGQLAARPALRQSQR
ncbi:MAG TPA: 23S rRNA (adenine(2503)-C(2))-methyltransferase RlmN [archaeon]|nr:23S rRNA (adenine(2503)-C(2))-methyltransferase RlmN [archaeon]